MAWLDKWPEEFRPVLEQLAKNLDYNAIFPLRELSGASGARTYLAAPESYCGRPNLLILKLGAKAILKPDLEGLKTGKKFFKHANYAITNMVEVGKVCCIPMLVAGEGEGKTFEEFYTEKENSGFIADVVNKLFREVLRRKDLTLTPTNKNVFRLHEFDDSVAMVRELRKVGADFPTLVDWWEKAGKKYTKGSFECLSHGDLHSRNIIVVGNDPYVIDFGCTKNWHIMRDFAKFEREIRLFLFLRSSKDPLQDSQKLEKALKLSPAHITTERDQELYKACKTIKLLRDLARQSVLPEVDWEFEYTGALLAQFIFAAGNTKLDMPRRKAALDFAKTLQNWLEEKMGGPVIDFRERLYQQREAMLWRLAYAFLRLDQLPSGGWSKTLAQWMEALWEGDDGNIQRNPDMRTKGGTDLTCYAFYHYLAFLNAHLSSYEVARLVQNDNNRVPDRVRDNFAEKIGFGGGIGVDCTGRAPTSIRIRHTLMGVIALLLFGKAENCAITASDELEETSRYLVNNREMWGQDKSHLFGMFAVLIKLKEMLQQKDFDSQLSLKDKDDLIDALLRVLNPIRGRLDDRSNLTYVPRPAGTCREYLTYPFFLPYQNFWRMERSNFLMYFPFLVTSDGKEMIALVDDRLRTRCADCFDQLLEDISVPFDPNDPTKSLVRYHRDPIDGISPANYVVRDWGLSAELAAVLELPAARSFLVDRNPSFEEELDKKRDALRSALLQTFDSYHTYPDIFKFTHGVSFGRYLQLAQAHSIDLTELKQLDKAIRELCRKGVTEKGLNELIETEILARAGNPQDVEKSAIRDMLVSKLESGEYTPDGYFLDQFDWKSQIERVVETTSSIYNGDVGCRYAERYQPDPIKTFVFRIPEIAGWNSCEGKRALDVGCGPGQYAKLLKEMGFEVELLDASEKMLKMASALLGLPSLPPTRDIYHLDKDFGSEQFDLIFACAMMVHVPRYRAMDIYQAFYQHLRLGGVFFVNFKLGDHSLISLDGRYFEYYRNHTVPWSMLEAAGFRIKEVTLGWNEKNMYGDPKRIHWANFFCRKLES